MDAITLDKFNTNNKMYNSLILILILILIVIIIINNNKTIAIKINITATKYFKIRNNKSKTIKLEINNYINIKILLINSIVQKAMENNLMTKILLKKLLNNKNKIDFMSNNSWVYKKLKKMEV